MILKLEETEPILQDIKTLIGVLIKSDEKGPRAFTSPHEILGALTEEYYEVVKEVKDDIDNAAIIDELYDVAVIAVWGILSLKKQPRKEERDESIR